MGEKQPGGTETDWKGNKQVNWDREREEESDG